MRAAIREARKGKGSRKKGGARGRITGVPTQVQAQVQGQVQVQVHKCRKNTHRSVDCEGGIHTGVMRDQERAAVKNHVKNSTTFPPPY